MNNRGIYILSLLFLVFVVLTAGCTNSEGMGEESGGDSSDSNSDSQDGQNDNVEENENFDNMDNSAGNG